MTAGHLVFDRVGKTYGSSRAPVVALEDFTLNVASGELHVIVGPSGCGKSTLLGAVAGFSTISSGLIELDGKPLSGIDVGPDRVVVFQDSTLFPWYSVADNVAYGLVAQRKLPRAKARDVARERLASVGLSDIADSYPGELSSGTQRRVEILRALVLQPAVLLLDEPFRGMDALSRAAMHDALLQIYDRSAVTVLFITHDIEEAVYLGSHVTVMTSRPGRVKTTIAIDLDRPRERHLVTASEFRRLVGEVSDAVRDEARLAFEAGEKEMLR